MLMQDIAAEILQRAEMKDICPILKRLVPQQLLHEAILKKFATSLFILSAMNYNFIYHNLLEAIPSLRTIQKKIVSNDCMKVFSDLKNFYHI